MVLLLRRLPFVAWRTTTAGSTLMVEENIRGKTAGYWDNPDQSRDRSGSSSRGEMIRVSGLLAWSMDWRLKDRMGSRDI